LHSRAHRREEPDNADSWNTSGRTSPSPQDAADDTDHAIDLTVKPYSSFATSSPPLTTRSSPSSS
jgi:hypothetical protein